jgi:hypothetical protein
MQSLLLHYYLRKRNTYYFAMRTTRKQLEQSFPRIPQASIAYQSTTTKANGDRHSQNEREIHASVYVASTAF